MAQWTTGPPGWMVNVETLNFGREQRLWVARQSGTSHLNVLAGFTPGGEAVFTTVPEGVMVDADKLPRLPFGIVDAIAEHLGPKNAEATIKELREALEYERARVDALCEKLGELAKHP